jgi:NADH-quinone oxidoreductase subunit I
MTNFYELAGPSRAGLIYEKQDLLAPLQSGMVPAPHPMVDGTTEKDYYTGRVTEATPEQKAWVEARTPPGQDGEPVASGAAGTAAAGKTGARR